MKTHTHAHTHTHTNQQNLPYRYCHIVVLARTHTHLQNFTHSSCHIVALTHIHAQNTHHSSHTYLKNLLHGSRNIVVLLADNVRVHNTGSGVKGVHSRVDAKFRDSSREDSRSVQMSKGCRRGRIGEIIGRDKDSLGGRGKRGLSRPTHQIVRYRDRVVPCGGAKSESTWGEGRKWKQLYMTIHAKTNDKSAFLAKDRFSISSTYVVILESIALTCTMPEIRQGERALVSGARFSKTQCFGNFPYTLSPARSKRCCFMGRDGSPAERMV